MKLFKKFLLAAATVGLVGSLGFTSQVKAADPATVDLTVSGENAIIVINDPSVSVNKISIKAGGIDLGTVDVDRTLSTKTATVNIKDKINASSQTVSSIAGDVEVKISDTVSANPWTSNAYKKSMDPLYRLTVGVAATGGGSVSLDNKNDVLAIYDYKDKPHTITATPSPNSGYEFGRWDRGSTAWSTNDSVTISVSDNASENAYTATFVQATTDYASFMYTTYNEDGTVISGPITVDGDTPDPVTLSKGQKLVVSNRIPSTVTLSGSGFGNSANSIMKGSGSTYVANLAGVATLYHPGAAGYTESGTLTINVIDNFVSSEFKIKGDDYVTGDKDKDYYVELTPTDIKEGTGYQAYGITWEVTSDSKATLTGLSTSSKTGTSVSDIKGVRVKYTGDSVDAGKTATIEVKATIKNGKASSGTDADFVLTHKITVYPKFSLTYSSDKRTLSYKAPAKINTGTTSGQDSDNKDATKTAFEVKGIKLDPIVNGSVVNDIISLSKTKSLGTDKTIDSSTIESIVIELNKKNKFSGDSCDLVFRAYPCDTDGKYNKEIKAEQTATVYKVVLHVTTSASSGTDKTTNKNSGGGVATLAPLPVALISPVGTTVATAAGTATDYVFYLLPGQEISEDVIASIYPALKGVKLTDAAGNSITKITGSSSVTSNNYNGVLGVKTTATADSAPDGQQKWGQGNTFAYIMMILVICGVCAGLYALNRKKSNI